jgi:hypothetical protein
MQVYSTLLVFVTQKLSMRRSLQKNQTLTVTHDNAAAWMGLGSALLHIWHQKSVPASVSGVSVVFLYLGGILILHITTPALLSPDTFISCTNFNAGTQGLPAFNLTGYSALPDEHDNAVCMY